MNQTRAYGCTPGLPDHRDIRAAALAGVIAPAEAQPPAVDLRPQLPPAYDQDGIGSCSSNAACGLVLFNEKKQGLTPFEPSRLATYYWAREMRGNQDSDSGSVIADNISVLVNTGAAPEKDWPYVPSKWAEAPPQQARDDAKAHEAVVYMRLDGTLESMKGCLAAGYPFEFGATLYASFEGADVWRTGDVPEPSGALVGGHAMLAVGYDDVLQRFRIRNSWGTGWGNQGCGTISYAYMLGQLVFDAWTIRQITGPVGPLPDQPTIVRALIKDAVHKVKLLGSWQAGAIFKLSTGATLYGNDWGGGLFVAKRISVLPGQWVTVTNPDGNTSDPYIFP